MRRSCWRNEKSCPEWGSFLLGERKGEKAKEGIRTNCCALSSISARWLLQSALLTAPSRREPFGIRFFYRSMMLIYKSSLKSKPPSGREVARRSRDGRSLREGELLIVIHFVLSLSEQKNPHHALGMNCSKMNRSKSGLAASSSCWLLSVQATLSAPKSFRHSTRERFPLCR